MYQNNIEYLSDFIENQKELQKRYLSQPIEWSALPMAQRQRFILMSTRLLVEETVEVNRLLQEGTGYDKYKPFKASKAIDPDELKDEVADIFIHAFALAAHAGIDGDEMVEAINNKLGYNTSRKDHTI